jgi:thioredoxin-related protein
MFRIESVTALVLSAFLLPTVAQAQDAGGVRDPDRYFFEQSFKDMPEELELARENGKRGLLVFFEMVGCPYCEHMRAHVFNQVEAQDWYRQHFRSVNIDIKAATETTGFDGEELTEQTFADSLSVHTTPTLIYFDLDGTVLYRHFRTVKTVDELIDLGYAVLSRVRQ